MAYLGQCIFPRRWRSRSCGLCVASVCGRWAMARGSRCRAGDGPCHMTLNDTLNHIIDDGIEAARLDYPKPGDILKREGSIAGFEACRGKSPAEIAALLAEANERARQAMLERD